MRRENGRRTHNVRSLYQVDELGILCVVDVCTEGDVVHGNLAWDSVAFHPSYFVRFIHDFLFVRRDQQSSQVYPPIKDVKDSGITRGGKRHPLLRVYIQ